MGCNKRKEAAKVDFLFSGKIFQMTIPVKFSLYYCDWHRPRNTTMVVWGEAVLDIDTDFNEDGRRYMYIIVI